MTHKSIITQKNQIKQLIIYLNSFYKMLKKSHYKIKTIKFYIDYYFSKFLY